MLNEKALHPELLTNCKLIIVNCELVLPRLDKAQTKQRKQ
ncbi:hypothetical protein Ple7327_1144 [Pleurocapsa sp. PCC 7327]|nr:hypothetical protein Ple7327_1144 [Pleurocapsa sp. PCC 7327]